MWEELVRAFDRALDSSGDVSRALDRVWTVADEAYLKAYVWGVDLDTLRAYRGYATLLGQVRQVLPH